MPSESTRPQPPVPTSVSDEARRYLASTPYAESKFPELDDYEGWLEFIAARDGELAQRFGGFELPVAADEVVIGGVRTDVLRAAGVTDAPDDPVYLSFHGGALVLGGGDACRLMGSVAAMSSGMVTWAPDYRMPPPHPYPAPLDDAVAVYRVLLEQRAPRDIVVGGGSAGGNLAAALLVRAMDEGLPMPGALVLLTPEVDLTESGDSFQTNLGIDNVLGRLSGERPLRQWPRPGAPVPVPAVRRRDRVPADVPADGHARSVPVEHRPHAPQATGGGSGGGAARLRGHATRGLRGRPPEDLEAQAELRRFLDRYRRSR